MRAIGEITDKSEAIRFGDYLYANGIANDVEEDDGTWTIWIHDDDLLEQAEDELKKFQSKAADNRYDEAAAEATKMRAKEALENERASHRQIDVRTQVFGQSNAALPVLSFFMIGVCTLSFLLSLHKARPSNLLISNYRAVQQIEISNRATGEKIRTETRPSFLPEITGQKVLVGSRYQTVGTGQLWRIITPIFIHFSFLHILFNMYWLYYLGGGLEGKLGTVRFAFFILLTAALSNLGQFLVTGSPFFGGMSGVNYALFGYLWIRGNRDPSFGIQLDQGTITILLIWFGLCFTGLVGNIANTAHTLGLASGAAWGWLAARRAMRG